MKNNDLNIMLIDLDSLLDTRLGTLLSIDKERTKIALENNYHIRLEDKFKGFTNEEFKKNYANRNKLTLRRSMINNLIRILRNFSITNIMTDNQYKLKTIDRIIINLHPYKLNQEELKILNVAIKESIITNLEIEFIEMDIKKPNKTFIKENVKYWFCYHYQDFLNTINKNDNFSDTFLFCPKLLKEVDEEFLKELKNIENIFEYTIASYSPIIKLEFLNVYEFSYFINISEFI